MGGTVAAVSRSGSHTFSKPVVGAIRLIAGLGVDGDAHAGVTVKHRSRVRRDPSQPNLRQVHLVHAIQLDAFQDGLMAAVLGRAADGSVIRKAGVMAVVLADGEVHPGDRVEVELPAQPYVPLAPV